jgi:PAS domain-containing protein/sigma-54 interacting transcriptional regulator
LYASDITIVAYCLAAGQLVSQKTVILSICTPAKKFEQAEGGTLLLDEIGEVELSLQAKFDESAIVAITDQRGIINYVNDKILPNPQVFSGRVAWSGPPHHQPNLSFERVHQRLVDHNRERQVWRGEIKNRVKDESYYWVDTSIVPLLNNEGKPYQYVAILRESAHPLVAETVVAANSSSARPWRAAGLMIT